MVGDGLLELSVQVISGVFTVSFLRLYIFPSGCPNFFFTSLGCGACSSQWCGSWEVFASPALHPSKINLGSSRHIATYSKDLASFSFSFQAPWFFNIICLKSSLYRNWLFSVLRCCGDACLTMRKSGGLSVPPFPFLYRIFEKTQSSC